MYLNRLHILINYPVAEGNCGISSVEIDTQKLEKAGFTQNTSYELFILGVSLLSFINLVLIALPLSVEANKVVIGIPRD